ncbi:MAG: pyridoxal-phosphate dependent enzyme [Spongiibacteraceae bacterium]
MSELALLELAKRAPIQPINWPPFAQRSVDVSLWRLDLLDVGASGNKLFKLAENLQAARREGYSRILSFGGAFSNHIHALALAGQAAGFATVGIIRGEEAARDNPTLRDAAAAGMQLHFVDRDTYRALTQEGQKDPQNQPFLRDLLARIGPCYIVPEGGANGLGVQGCVALGQAIAGMAIRPDVVALPTATGSTLAGIVAGLSGHCEVRGIAVLKGGSFIAEQVRGHLRALDVAGSGAEDCTAWRIELDHHCGGYARTPPPLLSFVEQFTQATGVGVEPVYSGKMLYAIHQWVECGEFAEGTRLLAVHTGGMQGARGERVFGKGS